MTQSERHIDLPEMPLPPVLPADETVPDLAGALRETLNAARERRLAMPDITKGSPSPANGEYREAMGEAREAGLVKRNQERLARAQQRQERPTPPVGWHLIAPTEAVAGDGLLRPDGSIVILDAEVFDGFPVEVRRESWAVRSSAYQRGREEATEAIAAALKARRDLAHNMCQAGWPLLTEAWVIAREVGRADE